MTHPLLTQDQPIYLEMMTHPGLFTHPAPSDMAILGPDAEAIKKEAQKHTGIRVLTPDSLHEMKPHSLDLIISTLPITDTFLQNAYDALHHDGILIQRSDSLFHLSTLKALRKALLEAHFSDIQLMHFPNPSFETGWRSAFMTIKTGNFKRVREKDIFNKPFQTQYYNFDVHQASLVLPEFLKEELITEL